MKIENPRLPKQYPLIIPEPSQFVPFKRYFQDPHLDPLPPQCRRELRSCSRLTRQLFLRLLPRSSHRVGRSIWQKVNFSTIVFHSSEMGIGVLVVFLGFMRFESARRLVNQEESGGFVAYGNFRSCTSICLMTYDVE